MKNHKKQWKKVAAGASVLALLAMQPLMAVAETEAPEPDTQVTESAPAERGAALRGGKGYGNLAADLSSLTDEQRAACDKALGIYQGVEDAVLQDLVSASALTQADVDSYIAQRDAEASLSELDMSAWTAEQYKAYYEAQQKTGDERVAAFDALAAAGQITAGQAQALSAVAGRNLWQTLRKNAGDNAAVTQALSTMQQAQRTFKRSLNDAGIQGLGKGTGFGLGTAKGAGGQRDKQNNRKAQGGKNQGNKGGRW